MANLIRIQNQNAPGISDPYGDAQRQQDYADLITAHSLRPHYAGTGTNAQAIQMGLTQLAEALLGHSLQKGAGEAADQADASQRQSNQALVDALTGPGVVKGGTAHLPITLDSLSQPAPSSPAQFQAPDLSQTPSAPSLTVPTQDPAVTMDTPVAVADQINPRHAAISAALAGADPRAAAGFLRQAVLSRALAPPQKPESFDLAPGARRYQEPVDGGPAVEVASNPKEPASTKYEHGTRHLDNQMAQDWIFDPDKGTYTDVGKPYKSKEAPATQINMQDPTVQSDLDVRARRIAEGIDPWPSSQGRVSGQTAALNAHLEALAEKYHPGVDATTYQKRQKTIDNFAQGPDGRKITAFNTVTEHLPAWKATFDALQNGQVPLANQLAQEYGLNISGKDPSAALQLTSQFVGGELANALITGEGTGGERNQLAADFSAKLATGQAAEVLSAAKTLMSGRLRSMRQRYESQTRKWDINKQSYSPDKEGFDVMLTPQSLAVESDYSTPESAVGHGEGGKTVLRLGWKGNQRWAKFSDGTEGPAPP